MNRMTWTRAMTLALAAAAAGLAPIATPFAAEPYAPRTVKIGGQEWAAENLSVATFRNGDPIPQVKSASEWLAAARGEKPAWCYYGNDAAKGKKHGRLYNWWAVVDPRGIAPAGWHVPTNEEWRTLIGAVGGPGGAFARLKEPAGFAAVPSGARYYKDASFNHLGTVTFWWTASKADKWTGWYHAAHFGLQQVANDNGGMNTGHSVRLVKDQGAAGPAR